MSRPAKNLDGMCFGRLTMIKTVSSPSRYCIARCDCGIQRDFQRRNLTSGKTKSCGCMATSNSRSALDPGVSEMPEYSSWSSMIYRCGNKKSSGFNKYGARGISVCHEWKRFDTFLKDMGPRPEGTSLDRIDPTGNYEPGNCRWADKFVQGGNKRNTIRLPFQGKMALIREISLATGFHRESIRYHSVTMGRPADELLNRIPRRAS